MRLVFMDHIRLKAVPKGRPRMTRSGHAFTPKKTRDFERALQEELRFKYRGVPVQGPVRLVVHFTFKPPKKPARSYPSIGDLDNTIKAVSDAANQILYQDDSQITELTASKSYGAQDTISIELWALTPVDEAKDAP